MENGKEIDNRVINIVLALDQDIVVGAIVVDMIR